MKKMLVLILMVILLTGCSNSVTLDFKENINTKINLSFSLDEYKNAMYKNSNELLDDEEAISSIEALRTDEKDAFINGNTELYKENNFIVNNNYYTASYEYDYNYINFSNNTILNKCFENFNVKQDTNNIYIKMSGKSICAPFKLSVKADNRMINNNSNNINNNEYSWNINAYNNDVYMVISKNITTNNSFNILYLILFFIGIGLIIALYYLNDVINKRRRY